MDKSTLTLKEIHKLLDEQYKKPRTIRTLRTWFDKIPPINPKSKPLQYDAKMVAQVLASHGITNLLKDYLRNVDKEFYDNVDKNGLDDFFDTTHIFGENAEDEDQAHEYVEAKFDQVKTAMMLKFLVEKSGYHFNDKKLREDLRNQFAYNATTPKIQTFVDSNNHKEGIKPSLSNMTEVLASINRIENLDANYYFRKNRSKQK